MSTVSHIAPARVPYKGNGRTGPNIKKFLTAIKNKSTFAIAKSIFFCFFRRNFASET